MAGIYIHIPYCKKKCNYCSFFISTCLNTKNNLIKAEIKELYLQKNYLGCEKIKTIYFGGGTPSLLGISEVKEYLNTIYSNYNVDSNPEITIECNPEDINIDKIKAYKNLGINRLSIGVQTFNEDFLKLLNRSNSLLNINNCLNCIKKSNFINYNIDLIYGIFNETIEDLKDDIDKLIKIHPPHISCYCLNIEPKTVFKYNVDNNILIPLNDDILASQFEYIDNILLKNGYIHYEISNYCLKGYESKHNLGYWNGTKYLGIGPSAHSYNHLSRQFNVENNYKYINSINNNKIPANVEILTENDKLNDYIFTHLRTLEGIDLEYLKDTFNYKIDNILINNLKIKNYIKLDGKRLVLTCKGMLIANYIISKMFL